MAPVWSSQPFTAIYVTYFLVNTLLRLPLRLIYYTPKKLRPVPTWSLKACLMVPIFRDLFDLVEATRYEGSPPPDPKKAKERYALVEPSEDSGIYRGILSPTREIKPASRPGLWYANPDSVAASNKGKVAIHFPSGGFIFAYDPFWGGSEISGIINKHVQTDRVLFAQYRISTSAATRFPAAIQDALTFYHYVLQTGVDAKDIILSGDSAGGNVVLALMRYLETAGAAAGLPVPGGAMVWSPWVHITEDVIGQYSQSTRLRTDCLTPGVLQCGADAYLPKGGLSADVRPFISPLHHPFKTKIPLFVQAGTAEIFYDEIRGFADEMAQAEGNRLLFHETKSAPHNILAGHDLFNFTPQAVLAASKASKFFRGETS
ncbi:hypothetical protein SLS62_003536 [Diatrype stigma]|uniref:Alpha/beta hydrolase fold-3 domain-containing protein n=1 Tax=Diatrype stigma TaxID=117547 RepID=A0AAN9UW07_9PEZI